jgi:hypothetical protein
MIIYCETSRRKKTRSGTSLAGLIHSLTKNRYNVANEASAGKIADGHYELGFQ